MSDPVRILEAKSALPEWLDWVLLVVFFVGPTVWKWIRSASQRLPSEPKPRPEVRRKEAGRPAPAAAPRKAAKAGSVPVSPRAASAPVRPAGRPQSKDSSQVANEQRIEELARNEASVWGNEAPVKKAVFTLDDLSGPAALGPLLQPMATTPALRAVLQNPDVQRALGERVARGAAPWRLVGAMQVAGVSAVGRVPGLREELNRVAGLPEEGIQIQSLQELQVNPEILVGGWTEVLFADALGLWIGGPAYAKARVKSLVEAGSLSQLSWNVRSGGMVLNPPARLIAPVLASVLRKFGAIREAQDLVAMVDEEEGGQLTLNLQGLGRPFAMVLPEEVLVDASIQVMRAIMDAEYVSLGKWSPSAKAQSRWSEVMPGVAKWGDELKRGRVTRNLSIASSLGLLWACANTSVGQVEAWLAKAQLEEPAAYKRQASRSTGVTSGGVLQPLNRQSLVESLLVGAIMAPPASKRGASRSQSFL